MVATMSSAGRGRTTRALSTQTCHNGLFLSVNDPASVSKMKKKNQGRHGLHKQVYKHPTQDISEK